MNPVPLFLLAISLLLLLGGCGEREDAENKPAKEEAPVEDTTKEVSIDEIEERVGVSYAKGATEPFTGTAIAYYSDGSKKSEYPFVNGKKHGTAIWHNEDGSKRSEISHMDGKKHGKWIGYRKDGSKSSESVWENGKKISEKEF